MGMKYCGLREDDDEKKKKKKKKKKKQKKNEQKKNNEILRRKLIGNNHNKKKKVSRIPWTTQETEAVIEGYEKYKEHEHAAPGKPGIWAYTLRDMKLGKILSRNKREGRNLKDKWRHLVEKKDERIQHLLAHSTNHNKISPKRNKIGKLPTKPIP